MPTKRTRLTAGRRVPPDILVLLGLGGGMSRVPVEELRELWDEWGTQVSREWQRRFGADPFVGHLAKLERWDD
jgi:hypothetical protein